MSRRFIALYSVLTGAVLPGEDASMWLEVTANGLADMRRWRGLKLAYAVDGWTKLDGDRMTNEVYMNKDAEYISTVPIEAKAAVLVLAGELFGYEDPAGIPIEICKQLKQICIWSVKEAPLLVRHSARVTYELNGLSKCSFGEEVNYKSAELIRHTPLAHFLPLCRSIEVIPLELVQAAIQNSVYRNTLSVFHTIPNVEAPENISSIDQTLLNFFNYSRNQLIYGVSRSVLDQLFHAIFPIWADEEQYFENQADVTILNYPTTVSEFTKAVYRGLGRALALSVVLGVPFGYIIFPADFAKIVLGKTRSRSELEAELRNGFRDIITRDILEESNLNETELLEIWRGYWWASPKGDELNRMFKFAKGSSKELVGLFLEKVEERSVYRQQLLQQALGISLLPVGHVNAVHPPVRVTFGKNSGKFDIESADSIDHVIKLV